MAAPPSLRASPAATGDPSRARPHAETAPIAGVTTTWWPRRSSTPRALGSTPASTASTGGAAWSWTRGASTASLSGSPKATAPSTTCRVPGRRAKRARRAPQRREARGREQRGHGHARERRIAVPARAIREALRHDAGQEMERRGRAPAEGGEVVAREEPEHLEQHAARAGRREGHDPPAAERAREGPAPARPVAGEVGFAQHPAARPHRGGDRRRARTAIEGVRPVRGDRLEGAREIGLHDAVVGTRRARAAGEEPAAELLIGGEQALAVLDLAREM